MARLRQDYQKFVDRNAEIIAIGPEDQESFADWWHKNDMPFTGVADPSHVIAKLYGQRVNWLKAGRLPALMVIDKRGDLRLQHFADSMSDIPSNESVLALLDDLEKEAAAPAA